MVRIRWTPELIGLAEREYPLATTPEAKTALASRIGCTLAALNWKAMTLGLTRRLFKWTTSRNAVLKRLNAEGQSDDAIARAVGCRNGTIVGRQRGHLGLPPGVRKGGRGDPWSAADEAVLRAEYRPGRVSELAAKLGRTHQAMWQRARRLGIVGREAVPFWTPAMIDTLERLVTAGRLWWKIGAALGVSGTAARLKANELGLVNPRTEDLAGRVERCRRFPVNKRKEVLRGRTNARYGLPSDLSLSQVRVLLTLCDGPATPIQLAERLSIPRGTVNYLGMMLKRRGLVSRLPVPSADGCRPYVVTAHTLAMLTLAAQEVPSRDH